MTSTINAYLSVATQSDLNDSGCKDYHYAIVLVDQAFPDEAAALDAESMHGYNDGVSAVKALRNLVSKFSFKADGVSKLRVYTDSAFVNDCWNKWLRAWVRNDWKTKAGGPVKTAKYWKEIIAALGSDCELVVHIADRTDSVHMTTAITNRQRFAHDNGGMSAGVTDPDFDYLYSMTPDDPVSHDPSQAKQYASGVGMW